MNRSTPSLPVHHQLRLPNSLTVKGWFKGKPEVLLNSGVLRPDNGREKVKGKGVSGYAAQWGKESACSAGNARDMGLIPRSGRSPGGRHGNPPQYSCLKNSMDRRSWQATVYRFTKIGTQLEWLAHTHVSLFTSGLILTFMFWCCFLNLFPCLPKWPSFPCFHRHDHISP